MLDPSMMIFGTSVLLGLGVLVALRCNPGSPGLSRHPTLYRKISRGRKPSRSRSPTGTRSL